MCLCNHKWSARNEEKVVVQSARTVQQEINTTQDTQSLPLNSANDLSEVI